MNLQSHTDMTKRRIGKGVHKAWLRKNKSQAMKRMWATKSIEERKAHAEVMKAGRHLTNNKIVTKQIHVCPHCGRTIEL
jgi:hypothetical protein